MKVTNRFVTSIKYYKNSVWYIKRRICNNKRVAKLVVKNSAADKGSYVFSQFNGNGSREIVHYDAKHSKRSVFSQKSKNAKEELKYILRKSATEDNVWYKEIINKNGDKIIIRVCT